MTVELDAPLFPPMTARDMDLLIAAALNDAYSCGEYDPTRAVPTTRIAVVEIRRFCEATNV